MAQVQCSLLIDLGGVVHAAPCSLHHQFLLSIHNAKDKTVRFRVCQLLAGIMSELKEDMELDDETWDGLQSAVLARCRDKIAAVRAEAARAMVRLQVRQPPPAAPPATLHPLEPAEPLCCCA
jgi:hypothetical protein